MIRVHILFLYLLFILTSCEDTSDDNVVKLPENLQINVIREGDNSRTLTLEASADFVNFYRYYFGEDESFEETSNTSVSHTYASSGEYELKVQAHTTVNDFVSERVTVNIASNQEDSSSFEGYESPLEYDGYSLVWQDEFEADELSDDYVFEIGTGSNGWGNMESQYYRKENTRLEDGYLVIEAKKENFLGSEYTSSRIITEGKKEFKYGRFDIRARMPYGQGLWPAIWMLGANFRAAGWPYCGEIDIMEMIGGQGREKTVHGTVHYQGPSGYQYIGNKKD